MKRVIIFGGSGFIGQSLVRRLLATTIEQLAVVDYSSSQNAKLPKDLRLRIFEQDIGSLPRDFAEGFDTAIHLSSNADIAAAIADPTVDFWHGTALTQQVLEICRISEVKRLLYASGSGVYGENKYECFEENYGPCLPISPYGASKLAGEAMISSYCHLFGLSAIAFRFANVVGPHQTHGVGYDFMRRLKLDPHCLKIQGDGTQSKAYIHVDDVINAVMLANEKHEKGFEVFNVSTMDNLTVRRIAEMAAEESGLNPATVVFEFGTGDRGWPGDVPRVQINSAKIRCLGWKNQMSSPRAMREALKSLR